LQLPPPSEPDVRLSSHPALQSRRWYDDSTNPFPYGTTVASRAKPSSMPPVATGTVLSSLLLLLAVLHHIQAITAWRWATTPPVPSFPHAGIVASSCEARWYRTSQVPRDVRRIEVPLGACCRPGAFGTTYRHAGNVGTPHHPFWVRCISHFHLFGFTILQTQISHVTLGTRSGRSTPVWLGVAELLSLGFAPSRVPLVNARQVDLTPLFMCSPLCGQSIRHVKWRGPAEPGVYHD
jgi:hypothetical protein